MTGKQNDPLFCEHGNDWRKCEEGGCPANRAGAAESWVQREMKAAKEQAIKRRVMGVDMAEECGDKTVEQTINVDDIMGADLILPNGKAYRLDRKAMIAYGRQFRKNTLSDLLQEVAALQHQVNALTTATAEMNDEIERLEVLAFEQKHKKRKWRRKARYWKRRVMSMFNEQE